MGCSTQSNSAGTALRWRRIRNLQLPLKLSRFGDPLSPHIVPGGQRPADLEERCRAALAIRRLADLDTQLHALSVRVTHLLEPPSVLMRPDIVERAKKFI